MLLIFHFSRKIRIGNKPEHAQDLSIRIKRNLGGQLNLPGGVVSLIVVQVAVSSGERDSRSPSGGGARGEGRAAE